MWTFNRYLLISITVGCDFPPRESSGVWYRAFRLCWGCDCSCINRLLEFAISTSNGSDADSWHLCFRSLSSCLSDIRRSGIALLLMLALVPTGRLCLVFVWSHYRRTKRKLIENLLGNHIFTQNSLPISQLSQPSYAASHLTQGWNSSISILQLQ